MLSQIRIDVRVVTVSFVGKSLKSTLVVVPGTEAEHREKYSVFLFIRDQLFKLFLGCDSDIKVTVGSHDDSVVAAFDKVFFSELVCRDYTVTTVCSARRRKGVDSPLDLCMVISGNAGYNNI